MPRFRATLRYGAPHTYHVVDVEADSLRAALREIAERFPRDADLSADLLEVRKQTAPDQRVYTPE